MGRVGVWSDRYKRNVGRLRSGDPAQVAKVVAELEAKKATKGLSSGEERMLARAIFLSASADDPSPRVRSRSVERILVPGSRERLYETLGALLRQERERGLTDEECDLRDRILDALRPDRRWRGDGEDPGGGAGVREPRRPSPAPPSMTAAIDEAR